MFRNYLKVALRNLLRHKGYTFINVFGLAVGIACCVLILLFVRHELSYDRFHEKAGRIHRVVFTGYVPNATPDRFAVTSRIMGRTIREAYPEVEAVVRLEGWGPIVKSGGRYFYGDDFLRAEPAFFETFSFPLLKGDPETALKSPNTLVITEEMERKYFGGQDAMGKTLTLDDTLTYTVSGVLRDLPDNSHLDFDFLVAWASLPDEQAEENTNWLNLNLHTYVLLREGADAAQFGQKISDLVMRYYGDELRGMGMRATLETEALPEIYLRSDRDAQIGPTGDESYVYVFSAIAAFVLLIACINFMNLSTARSMERAKEVGVRKVVGSSRAALVRQFLSESTLISLLGLLISFGLVAAALPLFNSVSGKEIGFVELVRPSTLLLMLGLALLVGFLAGSYPALALSSFKPVEVLKGAFRTSKRGALLRQGLVVFQFAVSVVLIVGTLIVMQQLRYMRSQNLGFDKEQVLVLNAEGVPRGQMTTGYRSVKQEMAQHPAVRSVSATNALPGRMPWINLVFAEGMPEGDSRRMHVVSADHDYVETMGIEMAAGRKLSEAFETDLGGAVLLNEAAVKNFGWKSNQEALGKWITFGGDQRFTVVGIFRDYHHLSLKQKVEPMIMRIVPFTFGFYSARVAGADVPAVVDHLRGVWERAYPGHEFEHFFLDDEFNEQYVAEERLSSIFGAFAAIAIVIACLGLFGLASFITAQRTKEIGVRKVLGASVPSIVLLLSQNFVRLVLVALVVASPLAYFAMQYWLKDFPYRISIGPAAFLAAGLGALLIALLTVSYQSIRAATSDPVRSLRYE